MLASSTATRWRGASGATVLVLALGLLAGCGSSSEPERNDVPGSLLRIYSSQPLVGPLADQGSDLVRAEELALGEAGDRVGRWRIGYVALNNASAQTGRWDPGLVLANARRAAQDRSTIAYVGEMDTGASAVSIPILDDAGILQVSPTDGVAGFTRARGGGPGEPDKYYPADVRNFVRLVPPDDLQARAMLLLMRRTGVSRLYVLDDEGLYGERLALAVARGAPATGILPVKSRGVDPSRAQPVDLAADVAASGADGFLWSGALSDLVPAFFEAVHAAAPGTALFGPSALADDAFAARLGAAAPRTRLLAPWPPPASLPRAGRAFAARFRARYGVDPSPAAVYGYEAMRLTLAAIRRAGGEGNDRTAVLRDAFGQPDPGSPLGGYSVDRRGDTSLRTFAAYSVRDGRLAFLHSISP
jgi:branched-chain amino acid transport system substrate-binding protein